MPGQQPARDESPAPEDHGKHQFGVCFDHLPYCLETLVHNVLCVLILFENFSLFGVIRYAHSIIRFTLG